MAGFVIGGSALVNALVVKDIYYINASVEWYFIHIWLYIFNADDFEDFEAFLMQFLFIILVLPMSNFRISKNVNLSVLINVLFL